MKSLVAAALLICAAPLAASAQGVVVKDIYTGPTVSQTDAPPVFAYPTSSNFCPAGLVPVQLGMEVSCGKPNVAASAADWNRPATTRYRY